MLGKVHSICLRAATARRRWWWRRRQRRHLFQFGASNRFWLIRKRIQFTILGSSSETNQQKIAWNLSNKRTKGKLNSKWRVPHNHPDETKQKRIQFSFSCPFSTPAGLTHILVCGNAASFARNDFSRLLWRFKWNFLRAPLRVFLLLLLGHTDCVVNTKTIAGGDTHGDVTLTQNTKLHSKIREHNLQKME